MDGGRRCLGGTGTHSLLGVRLTTSSMAEILSTVRLSYTELSLELLSFAAIRGICGYPRVGSSPSEGARLRPA